MRPDSSPRSPRPGKRVLKGGGGKRLSENQGGRRASEGRGGKRLRPGRWTLRTAALAGAGLCLLAAICGRTYSYFSAKDQQVNQFELSELEFVIEEPSWEEPEVPVRPGDVLPKDPQIVNTGETDLVVRVRIQEVWNPKDPASGLEQQINPGYVRYFAANQGGLGQDSVTFPAQQLLDILALDSQLEEGQKNFALRLDLTPNDFNPNHAYWDTANLNGWYRGSGSDTQPSEWLYYNQVVPVAGWTDPVFRAVTIRTGEDVYSIDDMVVDGTLTGDDYSHALEEAYAQQLAGYSDLMTQYDLDLYVYAETVQAEPFAWRDAWGDDLPAGWSEHWGVSA